MAKKKKTFLESVQDFIIKAWEIIKKYKTLFIILGIIILGVIIFIALRSFIALIVGGLGLAGIAGYNTWEEKKNAVNKKYNNRTNNERIAHILKRGRK